MDNCTVDMEFLCPAKLFYQPSQPKPATIRLHETNTNPSPISRQDASREVDVSEKRTSKVPSVKLTLYQ